MAQGGGKSEQERVRWLGQEIFPHEQDVRAWLRRSLVTSNDVDDVIQESYCRLANLKAVEQIESPRAYFFQTARSVVLEQMRRARIVRIDAVTEIDALRIEWDEPSPERIARGTQGTRTRNEDRRHITQTHPPHLRDAPRDGVVANGDRAPAWRVGERGRE